MAIDFLKNLGLLAAAVTSPLKTLAKGNTIYFDKKINAWASANTDLAALKHVAKNITGSVAVWGGGGLLPTLREVFPGAHFFSARNGTVRDGSVQALESYDVCIWAAGPEARAPQFKSRVVFDMNYKENSSAREWSKQLAVEYKSGEVLFVQQALAQQLLWSQQLFHN